MNALLPYFLPLIGLFFVMLGLALIWRSRAGDITSITSATRRKLGLIYVLVGAMLTALGVIRI